MIRSISIESFRGIQGLTLDELTPLVVLVGPNGCGKSTVLDAMLIGAAPEPAKAVRYAVERRREHSAGATWLFPRGGRAVKKARIQVSLSGGGTSSTELSLRTGVAFNYVAQDTPIDIAVGDGSSAPITSDIVFRPRGEPSFTNNLVPIPGRPPIQLIEPGPGGHHADLARVHAEAFKAGLLEHAVQLLADVVPGLMSLQPLQEADGSTVIYLGFKDGAIPAGLAGDGILALARLAFELALPAEGTALIEEPEAHQHPKSLQQSAKAIVAAVKRGVQVVLSTHSLELIDELLDAAGAGDRSLLSLYAMAKRDGKTIAVRDSGSDMAFARQRVGEDLR